MKKLRTNYAPAFKAKVALEAIKESKTTAELASEYQVHPGQIRTWKSIASQGIAELFNGRQGKSHKEHEELVEELYRQIGHLKVELDWLKKKSGVAR